MRRKALLAIAFAGGMLNSQLPALSQSKIESTDSVIQQLANTEGMPPDCRAFYLLRIASSYLAGDERTAVEAQFRTVANQSGRDYAFWPIGRDDILTSWADQVALEGRSTIRGTDAITNAKSHTKSIGNENLSLADSAIQQALRQLDKTSVKFSRLNMYFIASRLFQKSGNTDEMLKCNKVLEEAFRSCEESSPVDEEQMKAAASILNSMAYGVVPLDIPHWIERRLQPHNEVKHFSEDDFEKSDKLKRRAVAFVDRLAATNHLRRKAHRDLALWYMQLGKNEMADKEKQILFGLVGCRDDSILYPQQAGCGQLVWWRMEKYEARYFCGMG